VLLSYQRWNGAEGDTGRVKQFLKIPCQEEKKVIARLFEEDLWSQSRPSEPLWRRPPATWALGDDRVTPA
jgi:hypothetical protein